MSGVMAVSHFGVPVSQDDGSIVIFAKAHAALVPYVPYAIRPTLDVTDNNQDGSADNTGFAITAAPATLAVPHYIGVPQRAYAIDEIAMLLVGGAGKMAVTAAAIAAGGVTFLKVSNAGVAGVADGTTQTVNGLALACEANESALATINVQMLGLPVQV